MVIPTRNRRRFACRAAQMALEQTGVAVEVVVVDDGSTDGTAEELGTWGDPRLRVLARAGGQGVSAARNHGVAQARAEWVALLDDDDLWSPEKLRLQLDAVLAEDADWVYAGSAILDEQGRPVSPAVPAPPVRELEGALRRRNVIPGGCSNVMARADLLRSVGGFDENLAILADWDVWIRLARTGRAAAVADVLVGYTRHQANMHVVDAEGVVKETRYLSDKIRSTDAGRGEQLDWGVVSRFLARAHAQAGRRQEAVRTAVAGAFRYGAPRNLALALEIAVRGRRVHAHRHSGIHPPAWLDRYRAHPSSDRD